MTQTATLALDCRCTLGEGIVWSPRLRSLLWTDIETSTLWMYRPHDRMTRQWSLPDRLGSFAVCESAECRPPARVSRSRILMRQRGPSCVFFQSFR